MDMLYFLETLENVDFDMGDWDGETPLLYCICKRFDEKAKYFINKGANREACTIKNNWNPVYCAATLGTLEILELLIKLGSDVNIQTNLFRTALTKACWLGRTDSVRILLKHPNINIEHYANSDRTSLHMAVWGAFGGMNSTKAGGGGDSPECVRMLLEAGAKVNSLDDKGKTPLHTATQTGGTESIPILLEFGADINCIDSSGRTPLHTNM
jgi:ankyrin repeat protein